MDKETALDILSTVDLDKVEFDLDEDIFGLTARNFAEEGLEIATLNFENEEYQDLLAHFGHNGAIVIRVKNGGWDKDEIGIEGLKKKINDLEYMLRQHKEVLAAALSAPAYCESQELKAAIGLVEKEPGIYLVEQTVPTNRKSPRL